MDFSMRVMTGSVLFLPQITVTPNSLQNLDVWKSYNPILQQYRGPINGQHYEMATVTNVANGVELIFKNLPAYPVTDAAMHLFHCEHLSR